LNGRLNERQATAYSRPNDKSMKNIELKNEIYRKTSAPCLLTPRAALLYKLPVI
jgi:hypothetical protein